MFHAPLPSSLFNVPPLFPCAQLPSLAPSPTLPPTLPPSSHIYNNAVQEMKGTACAALTCRGLRVPGTSAPLPSVNIPASWPLVPGMSAPQPDGSGCQGCQQPSLVAQMPEVSTPQPGGPGCQECQHPSLVVPDVNGVNTPA